MISPSVPKFRKRHKPLKAKGSPSPSPAALVLVSAAYDEVGATLALTFDRAVDASGLDAAQLIVLDGTFNATKFGGIGPASVLSPTSISVALEWVDDAPLGPVMLDASALTGIVAVDDGGTWAGVMELGLPYDG